MHTEVEVAKKQGEHKTVEITVDGQVKNVDKDKYTVNALKTLVGVAADYELDEVVKGVFTPLADTAEIHIKGGEVFVSHVRQGSSS